MKSHGDLDGYTKNMILDKQAAAPVRAPLFLTGQAKALRI
jgi:hypothetical protein